MTSNSFFKYINSNFWSFLLITIIIISFFIFRDFWKFCIDALWVDPIVSQFIGNEWWIISICSFFIVAYYSKEFYFSELLNINRVKCLLMFVTIYFFCFFSEEWEYSLIISGNQYTAWANVFILLPFIGEVILFVRIRNKSKSNNAQKTPSLEIEKVYNIEDSYQRNKLYITTSLVSRKNWDEV